MKTSRILSIALLLLVQAAATSVFAQKAGDIITGVVSDNEGPMMMVNVTERDQDDRILHMLLQIRMVYSPLNWSIPWTDWRFHMSDTKL